MAGVAFRVFDTFHGSYIPEPISKYKGLSPGAKLVYARLGRYEGESGGAYPAVASIGTECGLSEAQARRYIRELQSKKFIKVAEKAGSTSTYVFLWHDALDGDTGQRRKDFSVRGKGKAPVHKCEPPPVYKSEPLPVHICEPEESHHQREKEKESHHASQRTERNAPKATKNPFLRMDDDKTSDPEWRDNIGKPGWQYRMIPVKGNEGQYLRAEREKPTPIVNTEQQAKQAIADLIGKGLDKLNVAHVLNKIGKAFDRAGWNADRWIPCWERVSSVTKKPELLGGGYYVGIAKDLIAEQKARRIEMVQGIGAARAAQQQSDKPRCGRCKGAGQFAPGDYCECDLGIELQRVETRKRKQQTAATPTPTGWRTSKDLAEDWYASLPGATADGVRNPAA